MRRRGEGVAWAVDAFGCDPARLRDRASLRRVFVSVIQELGLRPIGPPRWHRFPGTRGLTGFWMLRESHLACHTFPEHGSLCLNLFCCRPRPAFNWQGALAETLGARHVTVRAVERDYAPMEARAWR